jgi:hypothetical protein
MNGCDYVFTIGETFSEHNTLKATTTAGEENPSRLQVRKTELRFADEWRGDRDEILAPPRLVQSAGREPATRI